MRKKRGVLKLWMAMLLSFVGIVGVAGATILTLFLMGKFEDEVVMPQTINFVKEVEDGLGFYDQSKNSFMVASDFKLKIGSETENVTADKVELRFGSTSSNADEQGFISNGVIKVPKFVTIGKAFSVTLEKNENGSIVGNWLDGQYKETFLSAVSENVSAVRPTVKIEVDVSVEEIEVKVHKDVVEKSSAQIEEVVVGTQFTLDTIFLPANSKMCFSDKQKNKAIFFSPSSSFVEFDWESEKFVAKQNSGAEIAEIAVYTFSNAVFQQTFMDSFNAQFPNASKRQLTESAITYFANNPSACVSQTIKIKVVDVDVQDVVFNRLNALSLTMDKNYVLTVKSANADNNLGLEILDSNNTPRNELFGNVGIKLPKNLPLNIVGGNLIKVSKTGNEFQLSKVDASQVRDPQAEYYVLPNNSPVSYADYFWKLSSSEIFRDGQLKLNFFYEKDGQWQNFFKFESEESEKQSEQTLVVDVLNKVETPPSWKDNLATIDLTLTYDKDGNINPKPIDLAQLLQPISPENVYKKTIYFLVTNSDKDLTKYFSCKNAVAYSQDYLGNPLNIEAFAMEGTYQFYELYDSVLTATNSFENTSGKVYVVATTVKTDANNKLDMDGDKYKIVNTTRAKQINVDSMLSIANMNPTFAVDESIESDENGNFFIPSINPKSVLTFTLQLQTKASDDANKLMSAYNNVEGSLTVVDSLSANQFISLKDFSLESETENLATFKGTIAIDEKAFNENRSYQGRKFDLQLVYNDGKETFTKSVKNEAEGKVNDSFYIYNQKPDVEKFVSENLVNFTSHIENGVSILDNHFSIVNSSNDLSIEMKNASGEVEEEYSGNRQEKIAKLNELLTFGLKDQFGRTIDSSVYGIVLEEETESFTTPANKVIVLNSDSTQIANFSAANNQTVYLAVYVIDKNLADADKYVYTDSSKTQRLTLPKIKFEVSSEGIAYILQDSSKEVGKVEYEKIESKDSAKVEKFVTKDSEIALSNIIQIYAGRDEVLQTDLIFKLNSTINADLQKMMMFETVEVKDDEENFIANSVSTIKIVSAFGTDTTINFVVTNKNQTFEIDLSFVCLSDVDIRYQFDKYKTSANEKYLLQDPTNPAIASVFGGEKSYNLDELLTITSKSSNTYSWASIANIVPNDEGLLVDKSGVCSVIRNGNLELKDVYQYTNISFRLYYGVHSSFAPYVDVNLFVNPNILLREVGLEEHPFVNVDKLTTSSASSVKLETAFEFYRTTAFINNNFSFEGLEKLNISNFIFKNIQENSERFVKIENQAFVVDTEQNRKLNLKLGDEKLQLFEIYFNNNGFEIRVDASIVKQNGQNTDVKLQPKGETKMTLSIGFGENDIKTVQSIFQDEIEVVKFDGQTTLLLSAATPYALKLGTLSSASGDINGDLAIGAGGTLLAGQLNNVAFSPAGSVQNTFVVVKKICDQLDVAIEMNAIISRIGDKFVYYDNNDALQTSDEVEFVYNKFGNLDFKTLISNSATLLAENEVFQKLDAGKAYTILHDSNSIIQDAENFDGYGFYYNAALGGHVVLNKLSVVAQIGENEIDLTNQNLVTISENILKINHLAKDVYDSVYAVLSCRLSYGSGSFTWLYRIKIVPSFEKGDVRYPYAEDGEYLDIYSEYYTSENGYVVNLDEMLTPQNSRFDGLYRFMNNDKNINFDTAEEGDFAISKMMIDGMDVTENFRHYLDDNTTLFTKDENGNIIFNFKTKSSYENSSISLTIERTYFEITENEESRKKAFGSELYYTFKINQSNTYSHTLWKGQTNEDGKLKHSDNIYESTLTAGEDASNFIAHIAVSGNGDITQDVKIFNAYIQPGNSEQLSKALMENAKFTIEQGTTISDSTGTTRYTFEEDFVVNKWIDSRFEVGDEIELEFEGITYIYMFAGNETVEYSYIPMTAQFDSTLLKHVQILQIKPKESVDKNYTFKIGFFTDQKVVCKLNITVQGYYQWQLNQSEAFNFVGGEKYAFNDKTSNKYIFENIIGTKAGSENFDNVKIELSDRSLSDFVTVSNAVYDEETKTFDWQNAFIEFAHLKENKTFTFNATVLVYERNEDGSIKTFENEKGETEFVVENSYTFQFVLQVNASFFANRVEYADSQSYFGDDNIDISINKLVQQNNILTTAENALFMLKTADGQVVDVCNKVAQRTGIEAGQNFKIEDLSISYLFVTQDDDFALQQNGKKFKELFVVPLIYSYRSYPNVKIEQNYPVPDGKNELDYEFVAVSQQALTGAYSATIKNFFNEFATFAKEKRISVSDVGNPTNYDWTISIDNSKTSNVSVKLGSDTITKNLVENVVTDTANAPDLDITFVMGDTGAEESFVTFVVEVNKVAKEYKVVLVRDSIVNIETNYVNYSSTGETIYAEDLSKQDKKIFAENRIVTYETLQNDGVYYVKLTDGINEKFYEIQASNQRVVLDLGESLKGFSYEGTYSSATIQNDIISDVSNKLEDSQVYAENGMFKLTSRVSVLYKDGTPISFDGAELTYTIENDESQNTVMSKQVETGILSQFTLSPEVDVVKNLKLSLKVKMGNQFVDLPTQVEYGVKLALDFVVEKTADEGNLENAYDINAISSISNAPKLLSLENNGFGIRKARLNEEGVAEYYTSQSMAKSGGKISLQEYGFSNLQIITNPNPDACTDFGYEFGTTAYNLALSAGNVHEKLLAENQLNAQKQSVRYYTGLTPRVDHVLNSADGAENSGNYIVLQRNSMAEDWTIWAQGANNDGNFVMMKITYSVVIGTDENGQDIVASSSHNILFRVLPNSNIKFSNVYGSLDASTNEIISNKTYATNNGNVYTITDSMFVTENNATKYTINLFGADNTAAGTNGKSYSIVHANMRNGSSDGANEFDYTYSTNLNEGTRAFNNWQKFNDSMDTSVWEEQTAGVYVSKANLQNIDARESLKLVVPSVLPLGERNFFVDLEDRFEFKARFYFTIISSKNPKIASVSGGDVLKEGSDIAFGVNYTNINATTSNNNQFMFDLFRYGFDEKDKPVAVGDAFDEEGIKVGTVEVGNTLTVDNLDKSKLTSFELSLTVGENINENEAVSWAYTTELKDGKNEIVPVIAGDVLTKSIETPSGINSLQIFSSSDTLWKKGLNKVEFGKVTFDGEKYVAEKGDVNKNAFIGSGITVKIRVEVNKDATFGKYGISYLYQVNKALDGSVSENLKKAIYQTYRAGTVVSDKNYGDLNNTTTVHLSGIKANAFGNSTIKAVDMNSVVRNNLYDFSSDVSDLFVQKVEFFHDGQLLSDKIYLNGAVQSDEKASLLTNEQVSFVDSNKNIVAGSETTKDNVFKVPYINGIYFGTQNRLENVEMKVTLVDNNNPANDCQLSKIVSLERGLAEDEIFESTDILDNNAPVLAQNNTSKVFNDTLEIVLEKGESLTLVVNDAEISGIDEDGYILNADGKKGRFVKTIDPMPNDAKTYYCKVEGDAFEACEKLKEFEAGKEYYELIVKKANEITLTNTNEYAITEYVGISKSIVDLMQNLKQSENFFVYVTAHEIDGKQTEKLPTIKYNGNVASVEEESELLLKQAQDQNSYILRGTVSVYNSSLVQHIAHEQQLQGKTKQQELYFLIEGNESKEIYRSEKMFNIHPRFVGAKVASTIIVEDYLTITNQETGKEHYVISLENWAKNIKLVSAFDNAYENEKDLTISMENAYMFKFEIDQIGGAAFVDENGKITTAEGFTIVDNVITLKVYMKVSGNDGKFEDEKDVITPEIAEVVLRLKETSGWKFSGKTESLAENVSSIGEIEIPLSFGNVVVLQNLDGQVAQKLETTSNVRTLQYFIEKQNSLHQVTAYARNFVDETFVNVIVKETVVNEDVSTVKYHSLKIKFVDGNSPLEEDFVYENSDYGIIVLPDGYYIKNNDVNENNLTSTTKVTDLGACQQAFAVPTNTTLDLHQLFDNATIKDLNFANLQNKKYHVVEIDNQKILFNNLDQYTFNKVATSTVFVVMTYRTQANKTSVQSRMFSFTIIVYDNSSSATKEEKLIAVEKQSESATYLLASDNATEESEATELYSYNCLNEDATTQTVSQITFNNAGVFKQQYLVTVTNVADNSKTYKLVSYTFYVHSKTIEKTVAMEQATRFSLEKMIERYDGLSYEFNLNGQVVSEAYFPTAGENKVENRTYMLLIRKGETLVDVHRIDVTFKVVGKANEVNAYFGLKTKFVEILEKLPVEGKEYFTFDGTTYVKCNNLTQFEEGVSYFEKVLYVAKEDVEKIVKSALSISDPEAIVEQRMKNNVLEKLDDIVFDGRYFFSQNFVATYQNKNARNIKSVAISMFVHKPADNPNENEVTSENISYSSNAVSYKLTYVSNKSYTSFQMSNLAKHIKTVLNAYNEEKVSDTDSVLFFNFNSEVSVINLEETRETETYYIKVADKYYLFNITLIVNQ